MKKHSTLDWIAMILLIIGGLNWGLTAFDWNVVDGIFGMGSVIAKVIYILVGLSALYVIFTMKKMSGSTNTQPTM